MTRKQEADVRRLARIARYVYGERWQKDLSRDVGFNERTIRGYLNFRTAIHPKVWRSLAARLEHKVERGPGMVALAKDQLKALEA
jgi:hypothetical protein